MMPKDRERDRGPVARAMTTAGFRRCHRWWVTQEQFELIAYLAAQNKDTIMAIWERCQLQRDWKGEALIRAKPDRVSETRRLTNKLWHENRRKAGVATPAARKHTTFLKTVFRDLVKGGKE